MKKNLVFALVMVITLLLSACSATEVEKPIVNDDTFVAGTYTGEGNGLSNSIGVEVTVSTEKIESIVFTEFNESDFTVDLADQLIETIIENNVAQADTIAGATFTSRGTLEAVRDALSKAYVDGKEPDYTKIDVDNGEKTDLKNISTDVVVIGAGGAGMSSALVAKNNGAEVIIVEKMPIVGGNTKFATGGLNAAETSIQKALGIEDSVELYYEDTMKGGGNLNNPSLVELLAQKTKETVDWLIGLGADLSDVGRLGGASANRAHRPTGGAAVGGEITDVLYENVQEAGIEVRLETTVIGILSNNDEVTGVRVSTKDGEYDINAKAVIIATGGFGANNELVASFVPAFEGYGTTNHQGAIGDVIDFAKDLNVSFIDMEFIQTHPTVIPVKNYMITEAVRGNGAILVNRSAERFVDELQTRKVVSDAELAQEGQTAFLVFDQGVRESLSAIEKYYNKGFLLESDTIEGLAEQMGVPAEQLKATIDTYNSYVANENDPEFGRTNFARPIENGPYYSVEVGPAVHHTMGGVEIDVETQVYNEAGEVIKGLYAAGEVTGGVHGNNRLGGNSLSDITTYGRIAGENAAHYSKSE
ncbi:flavocytochrome c [Mycoplasmatota bacterium zrk1]